MKAFTNSKKLVISGMMLALGLILPYATAHGFGLQGNILLPMHIPVLMCGFICGPVYGALCGLVLPVINSLLTGMPAMYPMALIMTSELTTYGLVSGILGKAYSASGKLWVLYPTLIVSMAAGRLMYGLVAWLLLFTGAAAGNFSVITSIITGLPGIAIQLLLIPLAVNRILQPTLQTNVKQQATELIKKGIYTCVTVRNGKIETKGSPKGIVYIIDLYEKDMLKDAFVADKIVGKAAAMVFTLGRVTSVYAENISDSAIKWFDIHSIDYKYNNRSEYIVNRKNDGMCPMELTVAEIEDEKEAVAALKNKIEELRKK